MFVSSQIVWSVSNLGHFDLTWPLTSVQISTLFSGDMLGVSFNLSRQAKHMLSNVLPKITNTRYVVKKIRVENGCWLSVNFSFLPKALVDCQARAYNVEMFLSTMSHYTGYKLKQKDCRVYERARSARLFFLNLGEKI